jgi:membrane-associated phospholipid phosphatase
LLQQGDPFALESASVSLALLLLLGLGGLRLIVRSAFSDGQVHQGVTAFQQIIAFSALGATLSYMLAARGDPLWDSSFRAWDATFGLGWTQAVGWLDRRPWLANANTLFYHSLIPQMVAVVLLLTQLHRIYALRVVMFANILAGFAAILVSGLFPAQGNLFDPAAYPHVGESAAFLHLPDIEGLRSGALRTLDLTKLQGIVTFPSYHAAMAVIHAWGFWHVRAARVPGVIWSALIILATPLGGGHYFVDVIAGAAVAIFALWVARSAVFFRLPDLGGANQTRVPVSRRAARLRQRAQRQGTSHVQSGR